MSKDLREEVKSAIAVEAFKIGMSENYAMTDREALALADAAIRACDIDEPPANTPNPEPEKHEATIHFSAHEWRRQRRDDARDAARAVLGRCFINIADGIYVSGPDGGRSVTVSFDVPTAATAPTLTGIDFTLHFPWVTAEDALEKTEAILELIATAINPEYQAKAA